MGYTTPDTTGLLLGYLSSEVIPHVAGTPNYEVAADAGSGNTNAITEMVGIDAQMVPKPLKEIAGASADAVESLSGPVSYTRAANYDFTELYPEVQNPVTVFKPASPVSGSAASSRTSALLTMPAAAFPLSRDAVKNADLSYTPVPGAVTQVVTKAIDRMPEIDLSPQAEEENRSGDEPLSMPIPGANRQHFDIRDQDAPTLMSQLDPKRLNTKDSSDQMDQFDPWRATTALGMMIEFSHMVEEEISYGIELHSQRAEVSYHVRICTYQLSKSKPLCSIYNNAAHSRAKGTA